jgi:hypothetical protein
MIFDIANPPLCADSNLDSDTSLAQTYTIASNELQSIAPGDWVDVDPSVMNPDPTWGMSFQVCNLYSNFVGVLILQNPTDDPSLWYYSEAQLSPSTILNNFRHVPRS